MTSATGVRPVDTPPLPIPWSGIGREWSPSTTFPKSTGDTFAPSTPWNPLAYLRLRTDAATRFKKVDNAIAVIRKLLLVGESRFRFLNVAGLLKDVYYGVRFEHGLRISTENEEVVA